MTVNLTSPQMSAAMKRALLGAAIAALTAAIAWAATEPKYAVFAGIAGAALTRFIAEGGYDTSRAESNDVNKADVGYTP